MSRTPHPGESDAGRTSSPPGPSAAQDPPVVDAGRGSQSSGASPAQVPCSSDAMRASHAPQRGPARDQFLTAADEKARLDDTAHVVYGGSDASVGKVLYGLYVAALLLLMYGVTAAQAFFATQDPERLRGQLLSWQGAVVVAVAAGIGLAVAWRSGRVRGPALPPLPWIDHVVSGPLDRASTLRRWWLMAAAFTVTGAAMVGAVIGGGTWIARVGDVTWLLIGTVSATGFGIALLVVWLAGQVSVSAPARRAMRPREALRSLRLEDLRTQAARATRMGGSVLLGDLRALRLETATPITRARDRRLRPGRARTITPRRDLLGLRRQPGSAIIAALASALGAGGLTWALADAAVPRVVAILSGLVLHLGFSTAAEGLRLQGDNAGTPPLLGLSFRTEAVGHLAVPLLVSGGSALLTATAALATSGASLGLLAWVAVMVAIVTGTTMASAFRGSAPEAVFMPQTGPTSLLLWVSRQALTAAGAGGALAAATRMDTAPAVAMATLMAGSALWWGFARCKAVTLEHRI